MILAGDIGGTKTRLALYQEQDGALVRGKEAEYSSRSFSHFRDMVRDFMAKTEVSIQAACFGVPGPVLLGTVRAINLPWGLSERDLESDLQLSQVCLVNDLVATTSAIPHLADTDIQVIHQGKPGLSREVAAVLAPGTGLGQGFLHWVSGDPFVVASEGGHADFAPNNQIEIELLSWLLQKFQRVSYERVLSGPGLVNIYNFLKESNFAPENQQIAEEMRSADPAAIIASYGLVNEDALCNKTLDIFCSVLGAQAGNLVLTLMATAGVYLAGGIPPKIAPMIKGASLIAAYLSKGRLSKIVASTPLYLIKDDKAPLLGAAHIASSLSTQA